MTDRLDDMAAERLLAIGREELPDLDLGKYELVREVGRGGMGVVYEANDTQLGRRVALKLIGEGAGFSSTLRQRFVREAAAVGRLNHPHIAQVYDATPDWIAMQFVDGVRLLECGTDARGYAELLRDAARAVHSAHRHGVIHRDLKPSNLLVQDGHVYVVDFGLAKETKVDSELSLSGSVLGTPAFMPPEQAQGRSREVDERSDVYALGATLYHCLAGRPPFESDDVVELMRQVVERDPAKIVGVDADLETIARKALAKEPERRYQTAAALADDLQRWLDQVPIEARPPSFGYIARRFAKRNRNPLRAIAVVAILLVGAAAVAIAAEQTRRRAVQDALEVSNRVGHLLSDAEDHGRAFDDDRRRQLLVEAEHRCLDLVERADVAQAHYLLGRVLRRAGADRFTDALDALDRALERDPNFDDARFERGLLLAEFGDLERTGAASLAIGHYLRQAQQDLAATLGKVDRPSASLEESLSLRATDVLYGQARLALLRGEDTAARAALERLVELDPGHAVGFRLLAPLVPDAARRRYLQARSLDLQRGFSTDTEVPMLGLDRAWRDDGMLVDLPSAAGTLPVDVLSHSHSALRRVLRGDTLADQGMEVIGGVEFVAALDDLDRALGIRGAEQFVPALNNRAVIRLRIAANESRANVDNGFRVFGLRQQAIVDLDAALATQPDFAFALINRALARHAIAAQQARGGLPDEARSGFEAAATDSGRALQLLSAGWPGRSELEELRDACDRQSR